MTTWHVLTGVIAIAALDPRLGSNARVKVRKRSRSADGAAVGAERRGSESACGGGVLHRSRRTAEGTPRSPKQLKVPTPKRFLPSTRVDDVGDDPCTYVPPSLDECA